MYVDAIIDSNNDIIKVVERKNGNRIYEQYPIEHYFYVKDPRGRHVDIHDNVVMKMTPKSKMEKARLLKAYAPSKLCESDINPILRCLENNYLNKPEPNLHVAFFDIETDYDMEFGYSAPEDAFNRITAISVHLQWLDRTVCLALPPPTLTMEDAMVIGEEVGDCIILNSEHEMLDMFMTLIEDADVISGWNSEKFDILYIVNRIIRVMGKHESRRMCLWNVLPIKKEVLEKVKDEEDEDEEKEILYTTYELKGRIHLDYMQLYKKYTYEQRQSYSLENISTLEVGEGKVPYDKSLDHLYKYDFKKFLEYSLQDTMLLNKLDRKLQYISLANGIAHNNVVLFPHTMGTVTTTEQAIIIEAHANNKIVPNRKQDDGGDPRAAGGWTHINKKGLHKFVSNTDMNSLYPTTIRALNMSPETLVGQIRLDRNKAALKEYMARGKKYKFSMFWHGKFNVMEMDYVYNKDISENLTLDMADGSSYQLTGAEIYKLVFESGKPWNISANGTIFRYDKVGVIPSLLTRWYNERKQMQGKEKMYGNLSVASDKKTKAPEGFTHHVMDVEKSNAFELHNAYDVNKLLSLYDDHQALSDYMNAHDLHVVDGYIVCKDEKRNTEIRDFWDKRQLVRKINLNSVYGGLLNAHHRFFDQRIGQSTTLTGRSICMHMTAKTNEILAGVYDYAGESIIGGDTDSCYFSAYPILKDDIESGKMPWSKEIAIQLYDTVAAQVCDTFPEYVNRTFNIPYENGSILKSSREVVASAGLFVKRKKYALMIFDKEGKRQDLKSEHGVFKVTGLEIRRSDTPKQVQAFLQDVLVDILCNVSKDDVIQKITKFKEDFQNMKSWQKGTPKGVNGLNYYRDIIDRQLDKKKVDGKRVSVPGHVRASLYWNMLREINRDHTSMKILDGSKIVVCKLKETPDNPMKSVSYPIDENHLPEWFKELPFDDDAMMETVVDKKLENIIGVLGWDLSITDARSTILNSLFDFSGC